MCMKQSSYFIKLAELPPRERPAGYGTRGENPFQLLRYKSDRSRAGPGSGQPLILFPAYVRSDLDIHLDE